MMRSLSPAAAIVILSGVIAASHLGKVPPAIEALRGDLQISLVQAGFLLSLMQFAGMTIGLLVGLYCDRLGARRSLLCGQFILLLASLAGAFASSAGALLLLRGAEGVGLLMVVLPTPGLLRRTVAAEHLPLHMGLWGCYVALGTALAFFIGPVVIDACGWRCWWLVPAGASALAIMLLARGLPREAAAPHREARRLVISADALLVGLAFALYAGQWLAVVGFAPSLFADRHATPMLSGSLSALIALANILGSLAAAAVLHRGGRLGPLLVTGYAGMTLMAFAAFSPLLAASPAQQYLAILLFSAFGGLLPGCLFLLAVRSAPDEGLIASTVGQVQQMTSLGMCLLPPLVAKASALAGGWQATWWISGLASATALVALARLRKRTTGQPRPATNRETPAPCPAPRTPAGRPRSTPGSTGNPRPCRQTAGPGARRQGRP